MGIWKRLPWIAAACAIALSMGGCRDQERPKTGSEITLSAIEGLKSDVLREYRKLRLTNGKTDALSKTAEWTAKQEIVDRASIAADGETIAIVLKNGVELDIVME